MDSLSQVVLGAAVAASVAPRVPRRALLYGAALGTLPDLDTLALLHLDPVARFVGHRSFSHSLLVLSLAAPVLALLLWQLDRGLRSVSRWRWWLAVWAVLLTHPLLDAFTVYGTQLLWPLPFWPPTMWASIFIIDPLYTLPLLIAVLWIGWRPRAAQAVRRAALAGLLLSTAYLGWSLYAQRLAETRAAAALAEAGLPATRLLVSPAPFNTLLWRAVAVGPGGDGEAYVSLRPGGPPVRWHWTPADPEAAGAVLTLPAGQRLHWFSHGFLRAWVAGDRLRVADLRMGAGTAFFFVFDIARRENGRWQAMEPERVARPGARVERLRALLDAF
ncbi:MAG: membrane protein [Lysobacteraceae bacterium]|nr:MAG: membrane protein [Xanthomonadaceae bacterium]